MHYILRFLAIVFVLIVLSACSEEKPKSNFETVEYLKVEGSCSEDHVGVSDIYTGSLHHFYNKKSDYHSRSGFLMRKKFDIIERVMQQVENPHKYFTPSSVFIRDIPAFKFSQSFIVLTGVSEHTPTGENQTGQQYAATCSLKVVERLDHFPEPSYKTTR